MNHDDLKSKLYEFYDGELPEREARVFTEHLESCRECREELEFWKTAARSSFQQVQVSVPGGFSDKVMNRILGETGTVRESVFTRVFDMLSLPRWEVAAALSVLVMVFSYFSMDYVQSRKAAEAGSVAWADSQAEPDRWLFSEDEIEKDDLVDMVVGDDALSEPDPEV